MTTNETCEAFERAVKAATQAFMDFAVIFTAAAKSIRKFTEASQDPTSEIEEALAEIEEAVQYPLGRPETPEAVARLLAGNDWTCWPWGVYVDGKLVSRERTEQSAKEYALCRSDAAVKLIETPPEA